MSRSAAVDAYIASSADFARPILTRFRTLMHKACPRIEETMKWGAPFFEYRGIVAYMAAFKQHVRFGFWKRRLLQLPPALSRARKGAGTGGGRIRSLADLPAGAELLRCIRAAVELNEKNIKLPRVATKKPPLSLPADLAAALRANQKAKSTYTAFSPSQRRDYVEWLTTAKQEATRRKRLATAIRWMTQGKPHNWKYRRA